MGFRLKNCYLLPTACPTAHAAGDRKNSIFNLTNEKAGETQNFFTGSDWKEKEDDSRTPTIV